MMISRKKIVMGVVMILAAITALVFIPAKIADNREQEIAVALADTYDDEFLVTKSTVLKNLFSTNFDITVQSVETANVYDFTVQAEAVIGDYYAEQLHIEVGELIAGDVPGLVLAKTNVTGLAEQTALAQADISTVQLLLIVQKALTDVEANKLAEKLQAELGDIELTMTALVVAETAAFEGVMYEVSQFFQRSSITKESFDELAFDEQVFYFDATGRIK